MGDLSKLVRKLTQILSCCYSLHNSEEYWKNPEKFYPERFLEKDFKIDGDESMTFLPFGAGEYQ